MLGVRCDGPHATCPALDARADGIVTELRVNPDYKWLTRSTGLAPRISLATARVERRTRETPEPRAASLGASGKVLVAACALLVACAALAGPTLADCGATERWFVKVGTDPKADQVDLATPIASSVQALNALPSLRDQVPANDNKFRLPEETKVYTVQGFLALFKDEDDSDYHLVITDASGKYTPGGKGTDGEETGTSFIAEIPDPNCTTGAHGDPSVHSVFASQLQATRAKFEAKFPHGKGADTFLGIPVTVTGVAFYDRQHLQTGRAVNGIELHPLIDISFDGVGTPVPEPSGSGAELLTNSGFEAGTAGWTGTTSAIGSYEQQDPHAGQALCWLLGYGAKKSETLAQKVTIPANVQGAELSFWINIGTEEATNGGKYDLCAVQVRNGSAHVLKTLDTFSNLDETAGYVQKVYDLTQFKGSSIQVYFRASEDADKATSFVLDDVSLKTN